MAIPNRTFSNIQLRRGESTVWSSNNPVLLSGEAGAETDTGRLKVGNGVNAWLDLPYVDDAGLDALGLTKADIVHTHDAEDIVSGTLDIARIPTGTTGTTVALGNHTHKGSDITTGTISQLVLPASTTAQSGIVELATTTEARSGIDTSRAITPEALSYVGGTVQLVPTSVGGGTADAYGWVTLSGANSSVDIRGVFNAGYSIVEVHFDIVLPANDGINLRLRSGSISTGTNYDFSSLTNTSGSSVVGSLSSAQTYWNIDGGVSADRHWGKVVLYDAGLADFTSGIVNSAGRRPSATAMSSGQRTLFHTLDTAYDGFRIYTNGGQTMNGKVRVLGIA